MIGLLFLSDRGWDPCLVQPYHTHSNPHTHMHAHTHGKYANVSHSHRWVYSAFEKVQPWACGLIGSSHVGSRARSWVGVGGSPILAEVGTLTLVYEQVPTWQICHVIRPWGRRGRRGRQGQRARLHHSQGDHGGGGAQTIKHPWCEISHIDRQEAIDWLSLL